MQGQGAVAMISITAAVAVTLVVYSAAGEKEPPPKAVLAAITERGRDLAGYDAAAWHASDAVMAKKPKPGSVTGYLARKTGKGWVVAFGRLDEKKAKYLIAYEATQGKAPDQFTVQAFDPPKADAGFFRSAAGATEAALMDFTEHFEGEQRPYNVAVLPAEKDRLWVYFVPAPTKPGVWPLGGDVRYLMSADGIKIHEKRQLHKSVIENESPKDGDQKQVAGLHTHVLAETPEDTDVFHVLTRKPAVPELIRTEHFVFVIEPDGEARYAGKAEDVLKEK
jgi:hypothetical protein